MFTFSQDILKLEQATVEYVGSFIDKPAIDGITLAIREGSWTSIVGDNGSGKSTIAKAMAGMLPLTEGRLTIADGCAVHMVMQNPETQLLGETVLEELALSGPDSELTKERMQQLLGEIGCTFHLDAPVKKLSGGEKQLLNMACCMAAGADIVIFDEATSMLDPASRQSVMNSAARLHGIGRTIVWITHRMEELCYADRIIAVEQGRIVFDGSRKSFFYGVESSNGGAFAVAGEIPESGDLTPCEQFGFDPPAAVQVARSLLKLGHKLPLLPVSPQQLKQVVMPLCPSK